MGPIYFDQAATSWPKPDAVRDAVAECFGEAGGNPGRSGHRMSIAAARLVGRAREAVAALLGVPGDPAHIAFTKNATEALNLAIAGLVGPGDHVVTTSVEHNSVMRPLRHLEASGTEVTVVPAGGDGTVDAAAVLAAAHPGTRLIVTTHGSNVTGALAPVAAIAAGARERGIPYLVDGAQSAGAVPVDLAALGVDLFAFTGHKAMLGLTGTGGLVVAPRVAPRPLLRGGTGSASDLEVQPEFLPDAYESGTLNVVGLAGLAAGAEYLAGVGVAQVAAHEAALVERFRHGAAAVPGVTLYGPTDPALRCGVVSFNVAGLAPSDVGRLLDREFNIMSREGLHCAPAAHRTIGTYPTGTVRFSFGYSNTTAEVDAALGAVAEIASWAATREPADA